MQVLEYDRSFLASRILFDKFNGSLIISGAFGLFKKDTVVAAGGYDATTMGEDMELVVKLHDYCVSNDMPYLIRYLLVSGSRKPQRPLQAAQTPAHRLVSVDVETPRYAGKSQIRTDQLYLILLLSDIRAVVSVAEKYL